MIHQRPFFLLASAAVVSLSLGQAIAEEAPAGAPAAAAAPAEAAQASSEPAAAATESAAAEATASQASDDPAAAARAEMEKRYEEAMAARNARYEELRKQAAEVGLELPESPPWERAPSMGRGMMPPMHPGMMRPGMMGPGMPGPGMATDDAAAGEQTGAEIEQAMTPEDWMAQREQRWEEMRARAAEQGMELPETPPWEAAQQRRKEMLERYNAYRATIEAMTDEQKEAISALFGGGMAGSGCRQPMRARSGYPDYGYGGGPGMWRQPPQMPEMPQMPGAPQMPAMPQAPQGPAEAPAAN
jgi:hypothetical protein